MLFCFHGQLYITKFDIINILGKTKENLENKNKILLRGHEAIGIK
jgi:hypothetical protein